MDTVIEAPEKKACGVHAPDLETAFSYSVFQSVSDTSPCRVDTTWSDFLMSLSEPDLRGDMTTEEYYQALADAAGDKAKTKQIKKVWKEQKNGKTWVPATFRRGGIREDIDVLAMWAAVLDCDDGVNREGIEAKLNGYRYVAHTSYSHSGEKPKWRVTIPFSAPMPPSKAYALFEYFNKIFDGKLDKACKNPSHPYYLPAVPPGGEDNYQVFSCEGVLFDPSTLKAESADNVPGSGKAEVPDSLPDVDINRLGLGPRTIILIKEGGNPSDRSTALFSAVRRMIEAGLDNATIAAVLLNSDYGISDKPLDKGIEWTMEEIARGRAKGPSPEVGEEEAEGSEAEQEKAEESEVKKLQEQIELIADSCDTLIEADSELRRLAKETEGVTYTLIKDTFREILKQKKQKAKEAEAERLAAERLEREQQRYDEQELTPDDVLNQLNKKHAVIAYANRVLIMAEGIDPALKRRTFNFTSASDFRLFYSNRWVTVPTDDKFKTMRWPDFWLDNTHRRQYVGMTFVPGKAPDGYLNLWTGFSIKPRAGDCELLKQHVLEVLCSGDQEKFDYLWRWCAHMVQRPYEMAEVAVVLRGTQGTGKNTFVDALGYTLGRHYVPLTQSNQLCGRFSAHLLDALLVFANEAIWGGDKQAEGALKSMITDPVQTIEAKGKDALTVPNYKRVIAASNENWAAPRGIDDRRFYCLDVSPHRKGDTKYFAAVHAELNNGGHEALLYDLLSVDIKDWHPRGNMPEGNSDGEDMKLESMSTPLRFWHECLARGQNRPPVIDEHGIPHSRDPWAMEIERSVLYDFYLNWCDRQKITHRSNIDSFGKELRKVVDVGEYRPWTEGQRPRAYKLPDLAKAQEQFQQRGAKIDFNL